MKVRVTFDFGPEERGLLARSIGRDGIADYAACRRAVQTAIRATLAESAESLAEEEALEEMPCLLEDS